ncbi:MAG: aminopeptidase P family protein [Chitinophagales bacterium]|nr:aminopeptidase P family protein [Chitinophagales bacterium]
MTKYNKLPASFFTENRKRFIKEMKPNSVAIFFSNDMMPRSADGFHNYRQNPDFYYLTGIDQEDCILILSPDSPIKPYTEVLFLKETNEHIAVWEGDKINKEQGKEMSGIETVYWNDMFENVLSSLINRLENIYINLNENDRAVSTVANKDLRFANELKARYPLHNFERSAPIMAKLRSIKSEEEIETIQQACNITEKAFRRVLSTLKPGMLEYEVEAEVIYTFIKEGATGHAYQPIIASGKNACVLHYVNNSAVCKDGDLLLMDFGAEYACYASDLTRTIPVNGKFNARQKEVYNACLRVHNETKAALRTGVTLIDLNKEAKKMMASALIDIKLIDKNADKKTQEKLTEKYYPHGNSHFMGIDVHDIGNRYAKIENNMCFTIEPGIYIPDENIGIRIENDVIVNDKGNVDLMKNIPITVEEIEELMAK